MNLLNDLILLLSIIAAILAWVAKIRWSNEYSSAKNEVIYAKDEQIKIKQSQIEYLERQIKSLENQTPRKLIEHYDIIQAKYTEWIDSQQEEINKLISQLVATEEKLNGSIKRETNLKSKIKIKELEIHEAKRELAEISRMNARAKRLDQFMNEDFYQSIILSIESLGDYHYSPLPQELNTKNIIDWFFENFKDPVDGVPSVDGEYFFVYGGPYDAGDVLFEVFKDVDENEISDAIREIEKDGTILWVKKWQY